MSDGLSPSAETRTAESAPRTILILVLLALLAAALRFWRLGDWSFWADEIATLRDAKNLHDVITYPVGYALIGFAVKLFGSSEFAARLAPAVVGILSVPALYLIGRRLFSERAAILSAVLLAVSSYHIFFSQEARYYSLVMLLTMLGMWCAYSGLERNSRGSLVAAAVLLALAGATHSTAALVFPALALYAFWAWRSEAKPQGLRWANLAILFAPFIAGALFIAHRAIVMVADWHMKNAFSFGRSALTAAKLADGYEPAALICALLAVWLLLRRGDRRGKWLLCWALVPPAIVVLFVGFTEGGRRFALVSLPAFLLLAGEALDILIRNADAGAKKIAWILVAVVVLSFGIKDAFYFTLEFGQRPRWREAASYARARAERDGAWVMTAAPAGPEVLSFYVGLMGFQNVEPKPATVAKLEEWSKDRICYVIVEHTANVRPKPEMMEYLKEHGSLERRFQLSVRLLDYSLSIYRLPADGRAPGPAGRTAE